MTRIELLKTRILQQRQARRLRIDGKPVFVDVQTANVCVKVHDALSEENKAKFASLSWDRFVETAWRLCLRGGVVV